MNVVLVNRVHALDSALSTLVQHLSEWNGRVDLETIRMFDSVSTELNNLRNHCIPSDIESCKETVNQAMKSQKDQEK